MPWVKVTPNGFPGDRETVVTQIAIVEEQEKLDIEYG